MHRLSRLGHRWGSILISLPLLIVLLSGLLLQLKKQVAWVQPPTMRGTPDGQMLGWDVLLEAARGVPEAEVSSWDDVDRIDVRVGRGVAKIRAVNSWEVQVDLTNGEVLNSAYRRSDLIEAIHDGSWFGGDAAKLGVFLPAAIVLLGLWLTGVYLFVMPIMKKRSNRRARADRLREKLSTAVEAAR